MKKLDELKVLHDLSSKKTLTFDVEYDHVPEWDEDDEAIEHDDEECTNIDCVQSFGIDPLIGFYDGLPDDPEPAMHDLRFLVELANAFPEIVREVEALEARNRELLEERTTLDKSYVTAATERDALKKRVEDKRYTDYLLLKSYLIRGRQGWEDGQTESELMDEILDYLWNHELDPSCHKKEVRSLREEFESKQEGE